MKPLNKLIAFLKPFKELIAIVIFLAGVGYAAFTHFATAAQLADARTAIEGKLANQKLATSTSLTELKCLNTYNRDLLRAQIEEIAKIKLPDLNANDLAAAMKTIEGTARSMGITVTGVMVGIYYAFAARTPIISDEEW